MFAKLDAAMALKIFARKGCGDTQARVASDFGISQMTVSSIWLGKTWGAVTGMPKHAPTRKRPDRASEAASA
jgi:hypothetical protein